MPRTGALVDGVHDVGTPAGDDPQPRPRRVPLPNSWASRQEGSAVAAARAGTNPVSLLVIPTDEELDIARWAAQEIQACG
jgi:hypothetical protein